LWLEIIHYNHKLFPCFFDFLLLLKMWWNSVWSDVYFNLFWLYMCIILYNFNIISNLKRSFKCSWKMELVQSIWSWKFEIFIRIGIRSERVRHVAAKGMDIVEKVKNRTNMGLCLCIRIYDEWDWGSLGSLICNLFHHPIERSNDWQGKTLEEIILLAILSSLNKKK